MGKNDQGKKPAPAKGGKATGQEVKDPNTPKGVTPGSETLMSVDEVNPIPSQEGALQGASVIDRHSNVLRFCGTKPA